MDEKLKITKEDYQRAVDSQCACNLGALLNTLAHGTEERPSLISKIWAEVREGNCNSTDTVNQHPIIRLYAEQIMFLSSKRGYSEARDYCEKKAAE